MQFEMPLNMEKNMPGAEGGGVGGGENINWGWEGGENINWGWEGGENINWGWVGGENINWGWVVQRI